VDQVLFPEIQRLMYIYIIYSPRNPLSQYIPFLKPRDSSGRTPPRGLGGYIFAMNDFSARAFICIEKTSSLREHPTHGGLVVTNISSRGMPEALMAFPTTFSVPRVNI
jgi:hypothetical protein